VGKKPPARGSTASGAPDRRRVKGRRRARRKQERQTQCRTPRRPDQADAGNTGVRTQGVSGSPRTSRTMRGNPKTRSTGGRGARRGGRPRAVRRRTWAESRRTAPRAKARNHIGRARAHEPSRAGGRTRAKSTSPGEPAKPLADEIGLGKTGRARPKRASTAVWQAGKTCKNQECTPARGSGPGTSSRPPKNRRAKPEGARKNMTGESKKLGGRGQMPQGAKAGKQPETPGRITGTSGQNRPRQRYPKKRKRGGAGQGNAARAGQGAAARRTRPKGSGGCARAP